MFFLLAGILPQSQSKKDLIEKNVGIKSMRFLASGLTKFSRGSKKWLRNFDSLPISRGEDEHFLP